VATDKMDQLLVGDGWASSDLQATLEQHLRPKTIKAFLDLAGELTLHLENFAHELGIDDKYQIGTYLF
jgi:hypothetical protein